MINSNRLSAVLAMSMLGLCPVATQAQTLVQTGKSVTLNASSDTANAIFSESPATTGDSMFAHSLGLPSEKARTLQFRVAIYHSDEDGNVQLKKKYRIVFDGPAHCIRADVDPLPLPAASTNAPVGMFAPTVSRYNGSQTIEYDAGTHQYLRLVNSSPGQLPGYAIGSEIEVKLARGFVPSEVLPGSGSQIDGRKMLVKEIQFGTIPATGHAGYAFRYYIDADTGFMRRYSTLSWVNDAWKETDRRDYSDWVINAPVSRTTFAWTPPTGAEEIPIPGPPALLATGTMAPDFTCVGSDGKPLKLSDLRGKVVILDFWATWCGPCQRAMPHLEHVFAATKRVDVDVLAVCVWDTRDAYDKWRPAHKRDYSFPFAFDSAGIKKSKSIAISLYKVWGIPTQYVIDRDGKIAAAIVPNDPSDHRLEDTLTKLGVGVPVEIKTASK